MPKIFKTDYGIQPLKEGGHREITPTQQSFAEADGTDVRLDRVRIFDSAGNFVKSFLRDKMGRRFADNLPGTEDDLSYLDSLPSGERK